MRLLLLSSEFPPGPGGIGTHAHQVAVHMTRLGWEVSVITAQNYCSEKEAREFNKKQPFRVVQLHPVPGAPLEALYRYQKASRCLKKWNPDLMIATGTRPVWLTAYLSRKFAKPWVAIGHGTEFGLTRKWEKRLTEWAFQAANSVVCVSNFTWKKMLSSGIVPRSGCVIPNGADGDRFRILPSQEIDDFRTRLKLNHSFLLLTVGNVTPRKGQDIVIRAMPHILKEVPDVHYLIVGIPTKKDDFFKVAKKLNVSDHVHFLGKATSETVVQFLNCCDVFLMTSKHTSEGDFEGYGIAVVEAALCGKPVIVSANSGLPEAMIDGETGFVVPEGDEISTAEKVVRLLKDENLRRGMGESARLHSYEIQTWEHRAREYDSVFRTVLGLQKIPLLESAGRDSSSISLSDDFRSIQ